MPICVGRAAVSSEGGARIILRVDRPAHGGRRRKDERGVEGGGGGGGGGRSYSLLRYPLCAYHARKQGVSESPHSEITAQRSSSGTGASDESAGAPAPSMVCRNGSRSLACLLPCCASDQTSLRSHRTSPRQRPSPALSGVPQCRHQRVRESSTNQPANRRSVLTRRPRSGCCTSRGAAGLRERIQRPHRPRRTNECSLLCIADRCTYQLLAFVCFIIKR